MITDTKNRNGLLGFISGGFDALFRKMTPIKPIERDPNDYELVVIATPIWAGTISPAIRTYLFNNREKFKSIALLSVSGNGAKNQKAVTDFTKLVGKQPIITLLLSEKEVKQKTYQAKLKDFAQVIQAFN